MLLRKRRFKLAADVEGFLTDREGQMLYALAGACQGRGAVIEIGSWKGKSTIWLAQALRDAGVKSKLYAIDPHIGSEEHQTKDGKVWTFEDFKKNIARAGLSELIIPIVATSEKARRDIQGPVELLFIDGAHDYDSVMLDYKLWSPLVVPGGYIAFHDTPWPGVNRAIREIFLQGGFDRLYFADTLMIARKAPKSSAKDRWKTKAMLWANKRFHKACAGSGPRKLRSMDRALAKFARDVIFVL